MKVLQDIWWGLVNAWEFVKDEWPFLVPVTLSIYYTWSLT